MVRVLRGLVLGLAMLGVSLGLGVFGYHHWAQFSWLDSLLNASMILTGMGQVNELHSPAAKLFASFYALFSGVVFITSVAVVLSPLVNRFLHKFHLEFENPEDGQDEVQREADKKSSGRN